MANGQEGNSNIVAAGGNQDDGAVMHRRKRHTAEQIQELEAFFKEYPNPTKEQRTKLGAALGMDAAQVKFWFQNKRSQIKTQNMRGVNYELEAENHDLKLENAVYKNALATHGCTKCGGPMMVPSPLKRENIRLKNELRMLQQALAPYMLDPVAMNPSNGGCYHPGHPFFY